MPASTHGNPDRASIGDVVSYSVAIRNTSTTLISNVRIIDAASPILGYIDGTAALDGIAIPDPVAGPPMIFDIGDVAALADSNGNGVADPGEGGYRILTYSMVVGAGVTTAHHRSLSQHGTKKPRQANIG